MNPQIQKVFTAENNRRDQGRKSTATALYLNTGYAKQHWQYSVLYPAKRGPVVHFVLPVGWPHARVFTDVNANPEVAGSDRIRPAEVPQITLLFEIGRRDLAWIFAR